MRSLYHRAPILRSDVHAACASLGSFCKEATGFDKRGRDVYYERLVDLTYIDGLGTIESVFST